MTRQKVDVIPASVRSVQNGGQLKSQTNIRVAAYCRVSTGDESQQTSYTTQKAFYKDLITRKPGWIFAGMPVQSVVDGAKFAAFIDEAVADAVKRMESDTSDIGRIALEALRDIDGKAIVETMSPEFVSFVGDAYRSLKFEK